MRDEDFDSITAIAAERDDIKICMSSTPTGKRGRFYDACTNPELHYSEHYHPSMDNPNWSMSMEAEFRAQLSEQGYVHEILAEFGVQETGVFNKTQLDLSLKKELYAYKELTYIQRERMKLENKTPNYYIYTKENPAPYNPFRTLAADWDKVQAGSSLLVLDFDIKTNMFKVLKTVEVPRGEYSYDNAFKTMIELNEIYRPSWIYADKGSGEYLIERLRLYGEEHPESMMKNKVKGFQFKNVLEIRDPVTREIDKKPIKPFMVTQLQILIERGKLILSPFDELIYKQLIDYEVVRKQVNGDPVFSDKNEHFVDALGLAYLAFVLEFPDLTRGIKKVESPKAIITETKNKFGSKIYKNIWDKIDTPFSNPTTINRKDDDDLPGDKPPNFISVYSNNITSNRNSWGRRSGGRSSMSRRMW